MRAFIIVCCLLAVAPLALAGCPNACSGHGSCGDFDECSCHRNWQGGDCSQRVCNYHWAWVTTPQGDLNFDGDLTDGTVYVDDRAFSAGPANSFLITPSAPKGTWETWPAFHHSSVDEGHFYMECANRGLCNRKSGLCECFTGYTGIGCRRSTCAGDCNGHGRCLTINQFAADTAFTYALWDGDMARACKCDAGYTGASCEQRICPKGDDPLTKDHQVNDVQWVDIYSDCTTNSPSACAGEMTGGTVTFTFTDDLGQAYTTDAVSITSMGAGAADAANVRAALMALPNQVIPDVTVTEMYCETALRGVYRDYEAAHVSSTNAVAIGSGYMRCPDHTGTTTHDIVSEGGSPVQVKPVGNVYSAPGDDSRCFHIVYDQCKRFQVEFISNPGPQTLLTVDATNLKRGGKTTAQESVLDMKGVATKDLVFSAEAAVTASYTASGGFAGEGQVSGKTLSAATTGSPAMTGSLPAGALVEVFCNGVSLGQYTMATTVDSGVSFPASFVFEETIIYTAGQCDSTDTTMTIVAVSKWIETNIDLTGWVTLAGLVVETKEGLAQSENTEAVVDSVTHAAGVGYIMLSGTTTGYTATRSSTGTNALQFNGAGTKENVECADRGICDSEEGQCKCFKGYSGDACSVQNALAA